ncbi:DUF1049 domain-containing protein [Desulfovibrio sp. OttesenSCG-928-A18]|nr:DUF1049 domain-containing protein [Desulfovibrio sp. OttesenSCG-928-A18]
MRFIKVLLLLVIFVFGVLFFVQNSAVLQTEMKLDLDLVYGYHWTVEKIPFYFVVLAAFALGMLFALGLLLIDRIRLGCALVGKSRSVRLLEKQVHTLQEQVAKEAKIIETRRSEMKELPVASNADKK